MQSFPNRCQHIKVNGTQCGCPALRRNKLCFFHKRHHDERIQLNAASARRSRSIIIDVPVLEDANSIQISLMQIMRMIVARQIDGKMAGLLLYALQTASANLRHTTFNTTNVILGEMENGLSFDEALKKAQALGIAETDATHDTDGWDAAVKTAALITVLMDVPGRLEEIEREGIGDLTTNALRNGRRDGWPFKLVCRARRTQNGVQASVRPEKVLITQPMAKIAGASSYIYFETDIFPGLAITEENPGLYATAYGMLADFVRAIHGQHLRFEA